MAGDWQPGNYTRSLGKELSKHFRRHVYLWPVAFFTVVGTSLAAFVAWNKMHGPDMTLTIAGNNPEKCNNFANKKYRLFELTPFDYANYQHPRPRF